METKIYITLGVDEKGNATITDVKGLTLEHIVALFGKANIGDMSKRKKAYLEKLKINSEGCICMNTKLTLDPKALAKAFKNELKKVKE